MKKIVISIGVATVWVSFSEFLRNQILLFSWWTEKYQSLGLEFPAEPLNGAMWGVWSLLLAVFIYILLTKFELKQAVAIAWGAAFLMMWIAIGNLGVLPFGILWFAVPLSLLEVYIAALIINRLNK